MDTVQAPQLMARLVGDSETTVWGLTGRARLERALKRTGVALDGSEGGALVLARADFIYDESLIRALAAQPGCLLVTGGPAGQFQVVAAHLPAGMPTGAVESLVSAGRASESDLAATGLRLVGPAALASTYNHALRKRQSPYLLSLAETPAAEIERLMFGGAYKGVTDFVTKRVWPAPALRMTRFCARAGISPNSITFVSLLFVLLATWSFWAGAFGWGLCAAWMMCFLDTVDGKLARVTLTSTPFGNVFDHGIDLIHPPFWYYAWYHGLQLSGVGSAELVALWIVVLGYVGGRLQEGLFIWLFGIEIHTWRPVDSWFREITARRNPNLFILSIAALIAEPAKGFVAVALWTVVCLTFHSFRILQAAIASLRGRQPVSWLAQPITIGEP